MLALQVTLALVELHLLLTQTVLVLLELLVALLDLFFELGFLVQELFLNLKQFVTFDCFGLILGLLQTGLDFFI